jgi:polysaccharide pyruvyl transferase WcaK-like protein
MEKLLVFDTSVLTKNLGDIIICDAVYEHLRCIFDNAHFINTTTHDYLGRESYKLARKCSESFVAGSNLLSSNMNKYNQWKINLFDVLFIKNVTLVGVGWWQYQDKPNLYTKFLLNGILSKNNLHSVRDDYSVNQLKSIGITNVINTGCPTTWNFTEQHCNKIKKTKSNRVVFTLTDYNKNYKSDVFLINKLLDNYDEIYFWPQGVGDLCYLNSLINTSIIKVIKPSVSDFNNVLMLNNIDYIGTRLHAGIRSLQYGNRTLILAVDNRALEMSRDINLPVTLRNEYVSIEDFILGDFYTQIVIKSEEIYKWKKQFNV